MAAVHPQSSRFHSQHHHKSSNPFADSSHQKPPPLPPKSKHSSRMPAPVSSKSGAPARESNSIEIKEAVKETVVVRGHSDQSPRNRVGRSQTAVSPSATSNPKPSTRRSHSQDSGGITERPRQSGKSRSGKKGSQHADVIDQLDFTGVGPMFHHDGPFDACAPSRNRQRNMAPIHSWSYNADEAAIRQYGESAYPSAHAFGAFSNDYPEMPKKKVDAIAEAWGIHEPEPFEEFFAGGGRGDTPASSIYNGRDSHGRGTAPRRNRDGREARDAHKEHLDETHNTTSAFRPRMTTRRTVPPPQPIFVPDPIESMNDGQRNNSPGLPKRSKSLMQRIRKMRDAPNVPVGSDHDLPSPPSSPSEPTRPAHRPQNSFLGRFGGNKANVLQSNSEKPESYVFIDAHNKQLPATPGANNMETAVEITPALAYNDSNVSAVGTPGLGRKTSLMKRVGRVVRGR
ncbi:hypothetical protein AX17_000539 [Amanita inopinata Kibby_2008]|nr:hypothetical protein AX17_000539 [Amanita inopinata Kibby_2008]